MPFSHSAPTAPTSAPESIYPADRLLYRCNSCRSFFSLVLVWLAASFLAGASATAQSVSFSGSMLPLPGTSAFIHPQGVALDSSGDLYVADSGNNAVRELTLVDGVYQAPVSLPAPSGGYNSPVGIAVAPNGDVFVGDTGNGAIQRIPYGCTSSACVVTIGAPGTINFPLGVAVDSAGNVFVANSGLNQIVEIPALGDYATTSIVATGFVTPAGVAVDSQGNVFVASYGDSAVFEVPLVAGVYQPRQTIGSGFTKPNGVAFDTDGSLLIADTHNSAIKEIAAADISSASPTIITIAGGLSLPVGVVADPNGNLFIGDYGGSTSNGAVYKFMRRSVDFGLVPIASKSPALTLTFTFTANTTLQAPIVVTQGAAGSDFADAGTGSCTTAAGTSHAYAPGDICTLDLTLTPAQSGLDLGAAELKDSSGNLLATIPLFGIGTGPQIVFNPGVQTTKGSGFKAPAGLADDQAGTIYVADSGNNQIQVIGNGSTIAISGFSSPEGVALDGAGNIFIADTGNNAVKEIVAATGATHSLGGGFTFSGPRGVSIDRAGNLYVADTGNGAVQELSAAAGYSTVLTIRSGLSSPSAIAVDYLGDVFVIDTSSSPVREIVAADGAVSPLSPVQAVGSGWSVPAAIACDRLGNLYVADAGQALELPRNGTTFGSPQLLASGLASPAGIAVDSRGNVNISSASTNEVLQLQLSTPPSFTFATTVIGHSSTDSPQSVTVTNIGNSGLPITGLAFPRDFPQDPATTCTSTTSLAQNSACLVSIDFVPTTSSIPAEQVTLTDNTLNVAGSQQQISVSGNAVNLAITYPSGSSLPDGTVSVPYSPLTFQASGGAGTVYTWSASGLPPGLSIDSTSGTLSGTPTAVATSSVTVTATDSGTGSSGLQVSRTYQLTIGPATITVNWNPPASITYGSDLSSVLTATASVGSATEPSSFGVASYTAALNPGGTANPVSSATVLPHGVYTLTLSYTPADTTDYKTPAPVQVTLTVDKATPTVSAWPGASTITAGQPLSASALTGGSASVPGTFAFANPSLLPAAGTSPQTVIFTPADTSNENTVTGSVNVTVTSGNGNFTIAATPDSQSGMAGQSFSFQLQIRPTAATYPDVVHFAATGLPKQASVSFSPSELAANAGPQVVMMTISTAGTGVALLSHRSSGPLLFSLLLLPLAGIRRLRQHAGRLRGAICLLLLALGAAAATTALTGCGSTIVGGSYNVVVTATSGSVQQSTTVRLTLR